MWIKYWVMILLALMAGTVIYAYNDPGVGWKVAAVLDLVRVESASLARQISAIMDGWMKGR